MKISCTKVQKETEDYFVIVAFPYGFCFENIFLPANSQSAVFLKDGLCLTYTIQVSMPTYYALDNCVWLTNYITAVPTI